MTTSDTWSIAAAVLASLGGGAAIIFGCSSWLGKLWADRILANHQNELSKALHKHNVAAARIDTQRVDAIRDLYGALVGWHEVAIQIVAPNDFRIKSLGIEYFYLAKYAAWAKDLRSRALRLEKRTMNTAIYFNEDTYRLITKCGIAASDMSIAFYAAAQQDTAPGTIDHFERIEQARADLTERYSAEYEPARKVVIEAFRTLVDPTT